MALFSLLLAACGASNPTATPTPTITAHKVAPTNYVGRVSGTEILVAIGLDGDKLTAFVSDGQTLGEWFKDEIAGNQLHLHSDNGMHLVAQLNPTDVRGLIVLADNTELDFRATPASGAAGLYESEETINGQKTLTGWILLPDGQQRGVRISSSGVQPARLFQQGG